MLQEDNTHQQLVSTKSVKTLGPCRKYLSLLFVVLAFTVEGPFSLDRGFSPLREVGHYFSAKNKIKRSAQPAPIFLIISVIWQGDQILNHNIQALANLR